MDEPITDFELVWRAYPRKTGKGAARKRWEKIQPDTELVQKILDALQWQRLQPQWLRDGGQFIPHLATWLNQERWDDEPLSVPQAGQKTINSLRAIFYDDNGNTH